MEPVSTRMDMGAFTGLFAAAIGAYTYVKLNAQIDALAQHIGIDPKQTTKKKAPEDPRLRWPASANAAMQRAYEYATANPELQPENYRDLQDAIGAYAPPKPDQEPSGEGPPPLPKEDFSPREEAKLGEIREEAKTDGTLGPKPGTEEEPGSALKSGARFYPRASPPSLASLYRSTDASYAAARNQYSPYYPPPPRPYVRSSSSSSRSNSAPMMTLGYS